MLSKNNALHKSGQIMKSKNLKLIKKNISQ